LPSAHPAPPFIEIARLALEGEEATSRLGADLALAAKPGDLILLEGDLGAGKSTLARAFVRAFLEEPEQDVPSPTYTLVQSHSSGHRTAVHADLYRLGEGASIDDLGLDDMLPASVVLVEWPGRAPGLLRDASLIVRLDGLGERRDAVLQARPEAAARFSRTLAIRAFLDAQGHQGATRRHLTGDASARSYETVDRPQGHDLILMNAPRAPDGPPVHDGLPYSRVAHLAESVTAFVAVGTALIEAADLDQGLLLIDDLGRDGILDAQGRPIAERYQAAAAVLADLHAVKWNPLMQAAPGHSHVVPAYSRRAMLVETELFIKWYWPEAKGAPASPEASAEWTAAWNAVLDALPDELPTLVLRDHHSPNIIWRGGKNGNDRIGLIDFQDAVMGPSAYDVASLARDARVDIPPGLEALVIDAYAQRRAALGEFDLARFMAAFSVMAAQRNAKILGIFHRLNRRDGKPGYLKHLPRIERYFARSLTEPAMHPVAALLARHGFSFDP
jgi:N-acetylmuramate 1-kinase